MQRRITPISTKKRIKLAHWKHRTQPSVAGMLNQCQTQQHMKKWCAVQSLEQGRYFWWHLDAFYLLYKQEFWRQWSLNHMSLEYLQNQTQTPWCLLLRLHSSFSSKSPLFEEADSSNRLYNFPTSSVLIPVAYFLKFEEGGQPHTSFPWVTNSLWAYKLVPDISDQHLCCLLCEMFILHGCSSS